MYAATLSDELRREYAEDDFNRELRAEIRAQIAADFETQAQLLGESLTAEDVRLIGNPQAFAARCTEILAEQIPLFAETVRQRAWDLLSRNRDADYSAGFLAQKAINLF